MDYVYMLFVIFVSCTAAQNLTLCQNGGTSAVDSSGSDFCLCTDKYTGVYCEARTDDKPYCLNGGTETIALNSSVDISCNCGSNFTGGYCESVVCRHCFDQIYTAIFRNYLPYVRPAEYPNSVTQVTVYFTIINLLDIIEKAEQMKVMGFFGLEWNDDRLTWNPRDYGGVETIAVPAQDVWLPDIILSNTGTAFYEYSYKRDFLVQVSFDGTIIWEFGGIILTNCNIDMSNYPFDQQNCSVDIETWRYSIRQIKLVSKGILLRNSLYGNSLWNLTEYQAKEYLKYGNQYSGVSFSFTWKRKPLYYHMNIIVPAIMMVLACLGVYWLPSESGEKVSLAVTILLAFSVFLIIIMDNTPTSSSSIPLITSFVILVMSVTTLSLIVSIFLAHLNSKKNTQRVPRWLRIFCFKYLARFMCIRASVPNYDDTMPEIKQLHDKSLESELPSTPISNNNPPKVENNDVKWRLDQILNFIAEQKESDEAEQEWVAVGRVIDRLFFWISFVLLAVLFPLIFMHII